MDKLTDWPSEALNGQFLSGRRGIWPTYNNIQSQEPFEQAFAKTYDGMHRALVYLRPG